MDKKIKIIISCVLSIIIIIGGIFFSIGTNTSENKKYSKEFINAIDYIKNEEYIKAYDEINNSNEKEKEIIQTILLNKLIKEIDKNKEISEKLNEEAKNITDYLTYTSLYSKDDKYQQNIDKIYDEEFSKLYDIKTKITSNIMFSDSIEYYNSYFELLDLENGVFKNYEYNILNDKDNLLNRLNSIETKLNNLTDEYNKVIEKHPISIIPEEYLILLDLI